MEKVADFNFSNITVVKPRIKSIDSVAKIKTLSGVNQFVLNSSAVQLTGYKKGDEVVLLHNATEDDDKRFLITRALPTDEGGAKLGSTNSSLSFSFSGIYGSVLLNDAKNSLIGNDLLLEKGLLRKYKTKQNNDAIGATLSVSYKLVSVGEVALAEGEEIREIFCFVKRTEKMIDSHSNDEGNKCSNEIDNLSNNAGVEVDTEADTENNFEME